MENDQGAFTGCFPRRRVAYAGSRSGPPAGTEQTPDKRQSQAGIVQGTAQRGQAKPPFQAGQLPAQSLTQDKRLFLRRKFPQPAV